MPFLPSLTFANDAIVYMQAFERVHGLLLSRRLLLRESLTSSYAPLHIRPVPVFEPGLQTWESSIAAQMS